MFTAISCDPVRKLLDMGADVTSDIMAAALNFGEPTSIDVDRPLQTESVEMVRLL